MPKLEELLIISHVIHYQYRGELYAYGPYAREIEVWAELFPKVTIASPCLKTAPPGDCIPFTHNNISICPQLQYGGERFINKLQLFFALPLITVSLTRLIRRADVVHVRCPGNLGALGIVLTPFFFKHFRIAKYAGQWTDYPGETLSTKIQKKILSSSWWNAPVTVYGEWPNQPDHIIPFFTSVMTEEQMRSASRAAAQKQIHDPLRILFIGRLSKSKNVDVLIRAVKNTIASREKCICKIVGTGPEFDNLTGLVQELNLMDVVDLIGGVPFENIFDYYEWADALILASNTEGWPKALTEGMAYGLICIGSNRGLIPQILTQDRGILVEPGDVDQLTDAIIHIKTNKDWAKNLSANANKWSQLYTLNSLKIHLRELMIQRWGVG